MKRMKRIFLLVCLILPVHAFAQDAPKPAASAEPVSPAVKEKEKSAPATAIIPVTAVKEITGLQKDAQIANLQVGNLQLQIEKAKADLAKLQEAAKKAEESLNQAILAAAKTAGIASDKLVEYDITNAPDGAWILKKKDKSAAPAGK